MELARPVRLTEAGQLVKLDEEVEYRLQTDVDVYDRSVKTEKRRGVLIVTSHRLAWIDPARTQPLHWHLSQVADGGVSTEEGGIFVGSAKMILHLLPLPTPGLPRTSTAQADCFIKLSFKGGGRDEFVECVRKATERKSWVIEAATNAKRALRAEDVIKSVGIDGILKQRAEQESKTKEVTTQAFTDLSELEKHAKTLVGLTETYARETKKRADAAALSGSAAVAGAGTPDAAADIGSLVLNMGIIDPVTRAAAGSMYITEVARQLATFLRPVLERAGGMLTLTDVYCMYNRARAMELISPEDLLQAAKQIGTLRLGCRLRTFPSGLMVLQLDSFSEDAIVDKIEDILEAARRPDQPAPFITALDLSLKLKMPLQITQQHLLLAESRQVLCRDDSINGLRFYLDMF